MTLKETIQKDLRTIEGDMGNQVITWNGEQYICVAATSGLQLTLEYGGLSGNADAAFTIRKELFTDGIFPQSQEKVSWKSKTYRIDTAKEDVTGAFIRLICVDPSRGI